MLCYSIITKGKEKSITSNMRNGHMLRYCYCNFRNEKYYQKSIRASRLTAFSIQASPSTINSSFFFYLFRISNYNQVIEGVITLKSKQWKKWKKCSFLIKIDLGFNVRWFDKLNYLLIQPNIIIFCFCEKFKTNYNQ